MLASGQGSGHYSLVKTTGEQFLGADNLEKESPKPSELFARRETLKALRSMKKGSVERTVDALQEREDELLHLEADVLEADETYRQALASEAEDG